VIPIARGREEKMARRRPTRKGGGTSRSIEPADEVSLPIEATIPLGKKFESKRWKLDLVAVWCATAEPLEFDDDLLLWFRVNFTPAEIGDILEQSPPSAYVLSFELQPPASHPDAVLRVTNIGLVGEETVVGARDRSRFGERVEKGTDIGGDVVTGLGALAALAQPALALAGIGLGALVKGAGYASTRFFGKAAISTGVPFVLGERTFGWKFEQTDNALTPSGLVEGGARLQSASSCDELEVRASITLRDGERITTEFKPVPLRRAVEPEGQGSG
jgi:hypothetical protein